MESLHGTFGREHKYGKQHHLAQGAPPPGPEITTAGEHLVGEAATLGLQPGQELRYMQLEQLYNIIVVFVTGTIL